MRKSILKSKIYNKKTMEKKNKLYQLTGMETDFQ